MKVCISCGKTIPDNDKFCGFCGTPQAPAQPQNQAPEQPQYQSPEQPQYQSPAQPQYQAPAQPQYQSPAQPQYQAPAQPQYRSPVQPAMPIQPNGQMMNEWKVPKKRNLFIILIPVLIILIAAIALILIFVVFKKDGAPKYPSGVDKSLIDDYFEGIRDKDFDLYVRSWAPVLAEEKSKEASYYYSDEYFYMTDMYNDLDNLEWTLSNTKRGSEEDCASMADQFSRYYGVDYSITDCYRLSYDFTYEDAGEKYFGSTALDIYKIDGVWYIVWAEAEN